MNRTSARLATFLAVCLALSPGLAGARVGGGSSFGSRGGMTFSAPPSTSLSPYSAAPMQRSFTQRPPAGSSFNSPGMASPGLASPGLANRGGGLFGGGGFGSGLMGGLLGAGIGSMLFGGGGMGSGMGGGGGGGGFIGMLIQFALIFFIGRWLLRMFLNRRTAMAGPGMMREASAPVGGPMPGGAMGGGAMVGAMGGGGSAPPSVAITPADFSEFERLLVEMQAAWSAQDLGRLRNVASPEMLSYFSEQLSDLTSRGLRNVVSDVHLVKGDLAQAWSEGTRDYATVAMQFTMLDVTQDAQGRVVDGSATEHQKIVELWTFLRSPGGKWVLSAMQQAQ